MKIYSYVVVYDTGFAPNSADGYCTLACCKPDIRKSAEMGDWIVGTGSVKNYGKKKLVYAMKVTEKITFDEYYKDNRFKDRIDNIYYKGRQLKNKYHGKRDIQRDLNGKYVLISEKFYYFGKDALDIPMELDWIRKEGPKHKSCFDEKQKQEFENWITTKIF